MKKIVVCASVLLFAMSFAACVIVTPTPTTTTTTTLAYAPEGTATSPVEIFPGIPYNGKIGPNTNYYKIVVVTSGVYTLSLSNVVGSSNLWSVVFADADFILVEGFGSSSQYPTKTHNFSPGTYFFEFYSGGYSNTTFTFEMSLD